MLTRQARQNHSHRPRFKAKATAGYLAHPRSITQHAIAANVMLKHNLPVFLTPRSPGLGGGGGPAGPEMCSRSRSNSSWLANWITSLPRPLALCVIFTRSPGRAELLLQGGHVLVDCRRRGSRLRAVAAPTTPRVRRSAASIVSWTSRLRLADVQSLLLGCARQNSICSRSSPNGRGPWHGPA